MYRAPHVCVYSCIVDRAQYGGLAEYINVSMKAIVYVYYVCLELIVYVAYYIAPH